MTNAADESAPTEPPPAGTLPPQGPTAGGYATRFHLVRPYEGRYLGGVCAALGRATHTDPVLWRVILPVLTLFNGLGAVLYLAGVLLIPNTGDTGSPIEALAGRGRSRMSRPMTISLLILVTITIIVGANHIGGFLLVGIAVVAGIALLAATRGGATDTWPSGWPTIQRADNGFTVNWPGHPTTGSTGVPPVPPGAGAANVQPANVEVPSAEYPSVRPSTDAITDDPIADQPTTEEPVTGADNPVTGTAAEPVDAERVESERADAEPAWMSGTGWPAIEPDDEAPPTVEPVAPATPAYQEPFAPFGPYGGTSAYAQQYPGLAPTTVVTPPPARGAKVKVHSPVRRITVSAALLVVGFLGIIDVTGVRSVPVPMYFAAALATIGIGMFVGSFFGRVRGPITLGFLLVLGLMASATAAELPRPYTSQTVQLAPSSVTALQSNYVQHYGTFTLDLSHVPFAKTDHKAIDITMKFGQVTVILPPNTYTSITAHTDAGDLNVVDQGHSGINAHVSTVANADDQGKNGALALNISITAGDVEVRS